MVRRAAAVGDHRHGPGRRAPPAPTARPTPSHRPAHAVPPPGRRRPTGRAFRRNVPIGPPAPVLEARIPRVSAPARPRQTAERAFRPIAPLRSTGTPHFAPPLRGSAQFAASANTAWSEQDRTVDVLLGTPVPILICNRSCIRRVRGLHVRLMSPQVQGICLYEQMFRRSRASGRVGEWRISVVRSRAQWGTFLRSESGRTRFLPLLPARLAPVISAGLPPCRTSSSSPSSS
jgi:hypothetical protein